MRHILGISAYYHDSAAALLSDGQIIAAAQEERFSRKKNDERFPRNAVAFCLKQAGISESDLDAVVFYDKPIIKFARLLESYLAVAPGGWMTFPRALPPWLGEKLNLRGTLRYELSGLREETPILFTEHHQSHAASAFFPSPFEEAAILTVDGVGEWATTTVGMGKDNEVTILKELRFPHSLGLLYSAFTAYCGFRINSGEYKLMGLAPYGEPKYVDAIYEHLLDLKDDGSLQLNLEYFHFLRGLRMTNSKFDQLFGGPMRKPETPVEQRHMDVARSIQVVTEEIMLRLARHARELTGQNNLCMAGGVALNCVANGRILREKIFENIWIQPAAGDAGGALGAALAVWHMQKDAPQPRSVVQPDAMQGAFLGPEFPDKEIEAVLKTHNAVYRKLDTESLLDTVADHLADEKIVGWFQGRIEFGPRALGHRSILGDPRSPQMQSILNMKVKFRESFRPFAPAVLLEHTPEFFELETNSPYMLIVAPVHPDQRLESPPPASGLERLKQLRSKIPAVTHVDYSARVQTVTADQNPNFHAILKRFEEKTDCPVLMNTSFNVRGEPVVCTPDDAYRCFVNTEMDYLAIGHFLLKRADQPHEGVKQSFHPVPD
ncbi:carbamoyltransferase [Puniceicoccales bacterium CK1056]|uniref:Carbamoyltransferase n=1 Tax=Oceanipulchritudo coccoides TaxID=2706888 RepID=A0A6B2M1A5_9BACT|nr:carbamoyltransferase [Oceanipulchritudo coccoides]